MTKIVPVIMSGGAGSRLWPLSRQARPKQLLPLVTHQTMVQETAERFEGELFVDPVFICNQLHVEAINAQMNDIGKSVGAFIVEPVGRNTAPCAVIAAIHALGSDADLLMLVPADHHVKKPEAFRAAIERAVPAALDGHLVTFGISPDGPETGYGYIAQGEDLYDGAYQVDAFREKPDEETARSYLSAGNYAWNAGIFLFAPDAFLNEARAHAPAIVDGASKAFDLAKVEDNRIDLDKVAFGNCPSESIDYAIMEHTNKAAVVPCEIGWNDIGSFSSLQSARAEIKSDNGNNAVSGPAMMIDSSNCLVHTEDMPVSVVGLDNVAVIVEGGEIMVVSLDQSQKVKNIVTQLKQDQATDRL